MFYVNQFILGEPDNTYLVRGSYRGAPGYINGI